MFKNLDWFCWPVTCNLCLHEFPQNLKLWNSNNKLILDERRRSSEFCGETKDKYVLSKFLKKFSAVIAIINIIFNVSLRRNAKSFQLAYSTLKNRPKGPQFEFWTKITNFRLLYPRQPAIAERHVLMTYTPFEIWRYSQNPTMVRNPR